MSGYFADIESLLKHAISWARDHDRGCLYGKSADYGEINLRIDDEHFFEESFYSTIIISSASIPLGRRNEGLYRRFLQELDGIGKFGLRCHSVTENFWLAERHRKHGYIEKSQENILVFILSLVSLYLHQQKLDL